MVHLSLYSLCSLNSLKRGMHRYVDKIKFSNIVAACSELGVIHLENNAEEVVLDI